MKPEVVAFGGCKDHPIHLASTTHGKIILESGTSFASPIAARVGAMATESFDRGTSLLSRALIVHTARHPRGEPDLLLGHGCVTSLDNLLYCPERGVTVVFQGSMSPTRLVRLPIPIPAKLQRPRNVTVTWTIAALSPVNPNHSTEYTSCCIEETFYPHSRVYDFYEKGTKRKKTINIDKASSEVARLEKADWRRAKVPHSASGNQYIDENARRAACKWEPIVRKSVTLTKKQSNGLFEPCLVLHGISRNQSIVPFDYVSIVTITAPDYSGDLYSAVTEEYAELTPIRLRTEAETRIEI